MAFILHNYLIYIYAFLHILTQIQNEDQQKLRVRKVFESYVRKSCKQFLSNF